MAKLLLQNRRFIRCRKETQGEGHCKNARKTMETQIELTKTAVDLARLDRRANITKGENFGSPKTEGSVRKEHSSFATLQKKNQEAVHHPLSTKISSTLTEVKSTAD